MSPCDKAHAFADGMLEESESAEFRLHLADCARCQEEVETALVLSYMDDEAKIGSLKSEPVSAVPWLRRLFWLAIPAAAAAAALLIYLGLRDERQVDADAIARRLYESLGPTRSVDARFSYPGADRHRPYDVPRDERAGVEDIPPDVIAALEEPGQVAAYALIGAVERAAMTLESLPETADSLSDRAALAIAEQKYRDAVRFAAQAIELDPDHRPAIWNRAVALSRLGLPLAAAAGFERIAKFNEPGWSDEARERAGRLRDRYAKAKKDFEDAKQAVKALSSDHQVPPAALVRAYPGMMRVGLYDAARTATSAEQLSRLVPLAKTLDQHYGGRVLTSHVESLAISPARAGLARRYAAMLASSQANADPPLPHDAVSASQSDIALGALFFSRPLDESQRQLYMRLAAESGDLWLELEARESVLRDQVLRGRGVGLVSDGLRALERCIQARFEFRCLRLEFWIASALARAARADAAWRYAKAGWDRARRIGDMVMQVRYLSVFANFADLNNHISGRELPVMRAYLEEAVERWPACPNANHAALTITSALIRSGDLAGADRVLADLDATCPELEPALSRLELDAHLVRGDRARAERLVSQLRGQPASAYATYIAARALVTIDRERAMTKLREAIAMADQESGALDADAARASSYALAAVTAGRDGDFGAAIDWLARELGLEAGSCAIGIAHDMGVVIAARDAAGSSIGVIMPAAPNDLLREGPVVPARLVEHVEGCEEVDVFARPPFLGEPVLPPRLAWRFRESRARRQPVSSGARHLIVSDVDTPAALDLPALASSPVSSADVHLQGAAATPSRVLEELETVTVVEIHAHGVVGAEGHGSASLILSPDAGGNVMLTAAEIAAVPMRGAPLVLLSACRGAVTPTHPRRGRSLAAAFLEAGASAVVASPEPISDREAFSFFTAIRRRVEAGESVVTAVREERAARGAGDHWSNQVVVFE